MTHVATRRAVLCDRGSKVAHVHRNALMGDGKRGALVSEVPSPEGHCHWRGHSWSRTTRRGWLVRHFFPFSLARFLVFENCEKNNNLFVASSKTFFFPALLFKKKKRNEIVRTP